MSFPKGEERKKGEGQRWPTTQFLLSRCCFLLMEFESRIRSDFGVVNENAGKTSNLLMYEAV